MSAEDTVAPEDAKGFQAVRDAWDLERHQARVIWLTSPNPTWSCGTPLTAADRHELLAQSRAEIRRLLPPHEGS